MYYRGALTSPPIRARQAREREQEEVDDVEVELDGGEDVVVDADARDDHVRVVHDEGDEKDHADDRPHERPARRVASEAEGDRHDA